MKNLLTIDTLRNVDDDQQKRYILALNVFCNELLFCDICSDCYGWQSELIWIFIKPQGYLFTVCPKKSKK